MSLTVIIADDHPLFREALAGTLKRQLADEQQGLQVTMYEAQDFPSLSKLLDEVVDPDLILLDLNMPGANGFSSLIYVTNHFSEVPVLIVSAHEEDEIIHRAIEYGAGGFITKSSPVEDITQACKAVLAGQLWLPSGFDTNGEINQQEQTVANGLSELTKQQFKVATMVCQGLLNKQIAYELGVTEATVKAHVSVILKKLGLQSRTQVAVALSKLDVGGEDASGFK